MSIQETALLVGTYGFILGTFVYIFKRAGDFTKESIEMTEIPVKDFDSVMKKLKKIGEIRNELTSKKTEENKSSKAIRTSSGDSKAKRVQKRVRAKVRRVEITPWEGHAEFTKKPARPRLRISKKVQSRRRMGASEEF